jgi:hypothetical protein
VGILDFRRRYVTLSPRALFAHKARGDAKTNATGWYSLTSSELYTRIFEFLTKYLANATYAPLDRDTICCSDAEGELGGY